MIDEYIKITTLNQLSESFKIYFFKENMINVSFFFYAKIPKVIQKSKNVNTIINFRFLKMIYMRSKIN